MAWECTSSTSQGPAPGAAPGGQHQGGSTRVAAPGRQHQGGSTRKAAPGGQHQRGSTRGAAPGGQHQGGSTRGAAPGAITRGSTRGNHQGQHQGQRPAESTHPTTWVRLTHDSMAFNHMLLQQRLFSSRVIAKDTREGWNRAVYSTVASKIVSRRG